MILEAIGVFWVGEWYDLTLVLEKSFSLGEDKGKSRETLLGEVYSDSGQGGSAGCRERWSDSGYILKTSWTGCEMWKKKESEMAPEFWP